MMLMFVRRGLRTADLRGLGVLGFRVQDLGNKGFSA